MSTKVHVKAKLPLTLRIRKPGGDYLTVATTVTCVRAYNLVEGYILTRSAWSRTVPATTPLRKWKQHRPGQRNTRLPRRPKNRPG
jgi:hypothetical protein